MLPNTVVFAMMLSVLGKHLQFSELFLQTTEVDHVASDTLEQLQIFEKIPMNASARDELERLRTSTTDLLNLNENFTSKILEPLEPLEEVYVPWLQLAQHFLKNPIMEESQLVDIYQQFLNNKHVRELSNMDIATLQAEWNEMDLNQRSKDASERLIILKGVVTEYLPHQVDASLLSRRSAKRNTIHKLLTQQVQIGQLRLEVEMTEVDNLSHEITKELTATPEIPITLKTRIKMNQIGLDAVEILKLHSEFVAKIKTYYDLVPVEDFLALWVHVIQSIQQNTEFSDEDLEDFAQPLLNNENVQKFMRLDVTKLQAEWKHINLQMQACSDKLTELTSQLPDGTITEEDVLSSLTVKQGSVSNLVEQGGAYVDIIMEIGTTFDEMPNYLKMDVQPMIYKLQSIDKEFQVYQPKLMAAFKTLEKVVKLFVENSTAELIESGRLLSDENIQKANEIDVETLAMEWKQMDLIQRAKNFLVEWKAVKAPGDRVNQRGLEL